MNFCSGIHLLVRKEGKFLVLKRASNVKEPDCWDLPGGTNEWGEQPVEAAIRETKEEAGLEIDVTKLLGAWAFENEHGKWSIELLGFGEVRGGEISLEDKFAEYRWLTLKEMMALEPKRNHLEALFRESLIDLKDL